MTSSILLLPDLLRCRQHFLRSLCCQCSSMTTTWWEGTIWLERPALTLRTDITANTEAPVDSLLSIVCKPGRLNSFRSKSELFIPFGHFNKLLSYLIVTLLFFYYIKLPNSTKGVEIPGIYIHLQLCILWIPRTEAFPVPSLLSVSEGYNAWRDCLKPSELLAKMCRESGLHGPHFSPGRIIVSEKVFTGKTLFMHEGRYRAF